MHRVAEAIHRRAMIVLVSDLLDDQDTVTRGLAHFRKHNHDVILLQILDPAEIDRGLTRAGRFRDMESGATLVADPATLAREYRRVFGAFLDEYRHRCLDMRIDYRLLRTDQSPDGFVRAYLRERLKLT